MEVQDMKKEKQKKNSLVDYAIWADLLVNAAIFAFYAAQIIRAFQIGIDKCLKSGFEELELGAVGSALMTLGPVVAIAITMFLIVEVIYLILRLRGKQPYITEKYSIISVVFKVILVVVVIGIVLLF